MEPGEAPVQGYTSPLFQAVVAAAEALGWTDVGRAGWLSALGAVLSLSLCWLLARRFLPERPGVALLAPLLVALQTEYHFWATAGMDIPLYTLLLTAAALAYVVYLQQARGAWAVGVLLALTALAWPEGVIVWLMVMAFEMARAAVKRRRPAAGLYRIGAAFLLLYLPCFLWQWATFGYPFPNTYYAKTGGGAMQLAGGLAYLRRALASVFDLGIPEQTALPLVLAGLVGVVLVTGWFCLGRNWTPYVFLGLLLLGLLATTVLNGGDHFPLARFLMPALPIVAVLLTAATVAIWQRPRARLPQALTAVVLLALVVGWSGRTAAKVRIVRRRWRRDVMVA